MNERCLNPEELADFPAEDPRRAHVDDCPRCQAVMKSFAAFMNPADVPEGADLADAHTRLSGALDREIGPGDSMDSNAQVIRPTTSFLSPFRVRTLAAAAAVVIVAVGLSLTRYGPETPPQDPVLRGAGDVVVPFHCEITVLKNGGYLLNWPEVEEATSYRVVVYRADLEKLMDHDVGNATSLELKLPKGGAFCRVIALRDGDEVARSGPAYFDKP